MADGLLDLWTREPVDDARSRAALSPAPSISKPTQRGKARLNAPPLPPSQSDEGCDVHCTPANIQIAPSRFQSLPNAIRGAIRLVNMPLTICPPHFYRRCTHCVLGHAPKP